MPSNNQFVDALKKQGGCGLLFYGLIAIWLVGSIYGVVVWYGSDDPKFKRIHDFANECFNRKESESRKFSMDMSESERSRMIDECAAEYEDYLKDYLAKEMQK